MDLKQVPTHIATDLREAGHDDQTISRMSPKEVFEAYCTWNGLINWSETLWNAVKALEPAPAPAASWPRVVVTLEEGNVSSVVADSMLDVAVVEFDSLSDPSDVYDIPHPDGGEQEGNGRVWEAGIDADVVQQVHRVVKANQQDDAPQPGMR